MTVSAYASGRTLLAFGASGHNVSLRDRSNAQSADPSHADNELLHRGEPLVAGDQVGCARAPITNNPQNARDPNKPGPSCVSPRPQLKRESSPVASSSPSQQKLSQHLKYMVRARISEFESSHPSQPERSHRCGICAWEKRPLQSCRRLRLVLIGPGVLS